MSPEQLPVTHTHSLIKLAEEIGKPVGEVTAVDIINSYSVEDLLPSRPISPELGVEFGLEVEPPLHERTIAETKRLAAIGKEILENPNKRFSAPESRTERFVAASKKILKLS